MRDDAQARRCTTCGKRRFFHAQNRKNPALRGARRREAGSGPRKRTKGAKNEGEVSWTRAVEKFAQNSFAYFSSSLRER